ncbi:MULTISPECIES: SMI1/KNR4 family protein [unclassified Kitasatospora]|uniref:SMI1/KNR4 family protein n=1 Tax=unclassified Kitasatospora TaxID=2633591 RepID=UPI0033FE31EC
MRTSEVDWDDVRRRTLALRAKREAEQGGPRPPLPPPLTEAHIREAEEQFGLALPADYRRYLLHVSAGSEHNRIRELHRSDHGWRWRGDHDTLLARLGTPFPDHDTALAAEEEVWDRAPKEEDHADPAAFAAAHAAWSEEAEAAAEARVSGAVFLVAGGCSFSTLLVVSGPQRGTMWFDGRGTCDRLNPLLTDDDRPATFTEWYLDDLAHAERPDSPEKRAHTPISGRWFDDWRQYRS